MMEKYLNSALYNTKRSEIRVFAALAKQTPGCVGLTLGEPDFDTPANVVNKVQEAFDNHETHYIDNTGSLELRKAISEFEKEHNGLEYSENEIIVTCGATEALYTALAGVINPGDEVIIPTPAFLLYEEIVNLSRGVNVEMDTTPYGFQIDAEALNKAITPKTKAIVLNSPNNPTGCILNEQSLKNVYEAVKGKNIFVICDDVYRQLIYTEGYHSFAEFTDLREQLIVVQSFSKPYAMTGWRMGYLMADAAVKERLELLHQYLITSTPGPFQRAAIEALRTDVSDMREVYRHRRDYVLDRLEKMGLPVNRPEGAFYAYPSVAELGLGSRDFCTRMIKEELLAVTPGVCFGPEGNIRISYCYSDAELEEGLNRLESFVNKLRNEKK